VAAACHDFALFRADVAGVKYARTPSEQSFFLSRISNIREGLTIRDLVFSLIRGGR